MVKGEARVSDNALVTDHAMLSGGAEVFGDAKVFGDAQLSGGKVYGSAEVGGLTWIVDQTEVYDEARIISTNIERPIRGDARIFGTAQLLGDVEHSVDEMSSGVFYGFIHPEFMGDPMWGAERVAAEPEVTLSMAGISWETDGADCRYHHVGCAESEGCVLVDDVATCVEGAETPSSFERLHDDLIEACIE